MDFLFLEPLRVASEPIDHILNAFLSICSSILSVNGFFTMVINTIMNNSYLLISVSLLIIGFVIGIIQRLIRM